MKNILYFIAFAAILSTTSCSKDDPTPEEDQEEVSSAELTFTEVEREAHGDHYHYNDIANAETATVKFDNKGLPSVGAHLHLENGKTYRLTLKALDFAGRETQQTFIDRADIHQVFILGAPEGALDYVYADKDANGNAVNVGVTGYITVLKTADNAFTFRYILRHLNSGVKANIKASDWNNPDFAKFTGENDLDLKVEVHLVNEGEHDDD